MANTDRLQPVAAEAAIVTEQYLLGTILAYPQRLADLRDVLTINDFVEELHARIYECIVERYDQGESVTVGVVLSRLGNPTVSGVPLSSYLNRLVEHGAGPTSALPGYAKAIRDAAGMRLLQGVRDHLDSLISVGGIVNPAPIASQIIEQLDEIAVLGQSEGLRQVTSGEAARAALEGAYAAMQGKVLRGITTGLVGLDKLTGGFLPGQLIIAMGRPGMGKTALGIHFARAAARAGYQTHMAELEMTASDLGERMLSAEAYTWREPLPYNRISRGIDLTQEEMYRLEDAAKAIAGLPLVIDQEPKLRVPQIISRCRQVMNKGDRAGRKRGPLIVDYLGLIASSDRYRGQRVQEVSEITGALKTAAKELGIPIILLCQLNREVEHREDKHPRLADARESGSIEQDADLVIGLFREEYYLSNLTKATAEELARLDQVKDVIEIGVLKQRKGSTGWAEYFCDIGSNIIADRRGEPS